MQYTSERITLKMTLEQARSASHQGQCYEDVSELARVPAIARQLALLQPADVVAELKEWGWDAEQLQIHEKNLLRIVWVAACEIAKDGKGRA